MMNTADADAPAVIPMMSGEASGLRAKRLEDRSREPERGADEHGGQRAGEPQLADDEVGVRAAEPEDRRHAPRERDREVADRDRHAERDESDRRERRPTQRLRARVRTVCASRGPGRSSATEVAARRSGVGTIGGHSSASFRRRTRATKNGAPITAVTMPTCSSPGRATTRPMMSETEQQDRREDRGVRQHPPVVGTGDRARDVRHRQPDERDRSGRRGGSTDQQHHRQRREGPRRTDLLTERARDVVAQRQRVQHAPRDQRHHRSDGDERRQLRRDGRRPDPPATRPPRSGTGPTWRRRLSRIAVVIEPRNAVIAAPASASFTGVAPSRPSDPNA